MGSLSTRLERSSLEHLRTQLVDRQREALAAPTGSKERSLGFSLVLFEHAQDHLGAYRGLIGGRGGAVALGVILQILSDLVRSELDETVDQDASAAIPPKLVVRYIVGAYMAVLTWWLDGGRKYRPLELDTMIRCLTSEGIGSAVSLK